MNVSLEDIGKKFGNHWIFRNLNYEIQSGDFVAITGNNGAGKSTLLQLISGFNTPSEGRILHNGSAIDADVQSCTIIGPYSEIIEEFTLKEFLTFHAHFKKALISIEEMAQSASLPLDKYIGDFSTGMKQRAKLLTAFFFENRLILMDEPTSNLDQEGFNWWKTQLDMLQNSTVVIASNLSSEIESCRSQINL